MNGRLISNSFLVTLFTLNSLIASSEMETTVPVTIRMHKPITLREMGYIRVTLGDDEKASSLGILNIQGSGRDSFSGKKAVLGLRHDPLGKDIKRLDEWRYGELKPKRVLYYPPHSHTVFVPSSEIGGDKNLYVTYLLDTVRIHASSNMGQENKSVFQYSYIVWGGMKDQQVMSLRDVVPINELGQELVGLDIDIVWHTLEQGMPIYAIKPSYK